MINTPLKLFNVLYIYTQEDQNRGKPNWEHLSDDLHVLLTVEDTENRAQIKLARAVEEVKKLLVPVSNRKKMDKQILETLRILFYVAVIANPRMTNLREYLLPISSTNNTR